MFYIIGSILLLFLALFLISQRKPQPLSEEEEREGYIQMLDKEIEDRINRLNELEHAIVNRTTDKSNNYTKMENKVLDVYEQSNIRLPLDILEHIRQNPNHNESEMMDAIENQRQHWKLENSKKPMKVGMKN